MKNIPQLNKLATELVGDGEKINVFFVSLGSNVQMVTTEFEPAYKLWRTLTRENSSAETYLEDRKWGVIADRSPAAEAANSRLVTHDDSWEFCKCFRLPVVY